MEGRQREYGRLAIAAAGMKVTEVEAASKLNLYISRTPKRKERHLIIHLHGKVSVEVKVTRVSVGR